MDKIKELLAIQSSQRIILNLLEKIEHNPQDSMRDYLIDKWVELETQKLEILKDIKNNPYD